MAKITNDKTKVNSLDCPSLAEFYEKIGSITKKIAPINRAPILLWRGQGDADWDLVPGLQIQNKNNPERIQNIEQRLFSEFCNAAPFMLPSNPGNDWHRLSLAQHFGLKTRLLDWTVNPTIALWFALSVQLNCDAAVWAFYPSGESMINSEEMSKTSPFAVKKTTVFQPIFHSTRVAAQAGWHSVHKYQDGKGLLAINRMESHRPYLTKLIIRNKYRGDILKDLEKTGVTVNTVFGDLQSLCLHANIRHL